MSTEGTRRARRIRRVRATDPIVTEARYDYVDAFEARLPASDRHTPEAWVRAGFANTGWLVNWVVGLLGMTENSDDQLADWQVVESTPRVLHLRQSDAWMDVVFVARNVDPTRRTLTTALTYRRRLLGRVLWAVVGILHRRTARRIIATDPSTTSRDEVPT